MSRNWSFGWTREWFRVGIFSGIDSLVRNLVYSLVILRSMNLLSEAGLYWTTNTFIWSYILLPFLPLSELLKLDISAESNQELHHTRKMSGYIILTLLIISFWIIIIPLWSVFFKYLLNVEDPGEHVDLALILFPFYIFFMLGDLLTGVMYSLGRTDFIALKSLLTNIIISSFQFFTEEKMCTLLSPEGSRMLGHAEDLNTEANAALQALLLVSAM